MTKKIRPMPVKLKNPQQESQPDSPRGSVIMPLDAVKLDAKFYAAVHKVKNGKSVPDDEWMIFLAQDDAFPGTLQFYREECVRLGADKEHIAAVERTLERLHEWRKAHPERCKVPGAKGEKLLG